jgi:putative oxidoreductase
MDVVFFLSRIAFGLVFLSVGVELHNQHGSATRRARSLGVPNPDIAIRAAEIMLIVGGLSVLFGVFADLGALLLLAVLVPATYFMHPFWKERNGRRREAKYLQFLTNAALIGGVLLLFWTYNQLQDAAPISFTDPFFGAF